VACSSIERTEGALGMSRQESRRISQERLGGWRLPKHLSEVLNGKGRRDCWGM
jgi:hypothetical protein